MRVELTRVPTFDDILADADFIALAEQFQNSESVRRFVPGVIRQFRESPRPDGLTRYASFWAHKHRADAVDSTAIDTATQLLAQLYQTWDHMLALLRGALVEGLVEAQLHDRYAQNRLTNNCFVKLSDGIDYATSTSVDVVGWDGARGECHDCKARAKNVDVAFIQEMETNLPTPEFKIGVVSVDSAVTMAQGLSQRGYSPRPITTLIALEDLADLAPLQARH